MPTGSVSALNPGITPPVYSVTAGSAEAGVALHAITAAAASTAERLDLIRATVQIVTGARGL
jgi:hypothetical protein